MANIFDYMAWRGDLLFTQAPFNEVDNLILSELSYIDFSGLVPSLEEGGAIPLAKAAELYFDAWGEERIHLGLFVPDTIPKLFRQLAQSARYKDLVLMGYVNRIEFATEEQFSALTILLPDDTAYVAFRGTDDTIVGWKENFNMSFLSAVPAQLDAARYVEAIAQARPELLIVGGHSKGGNLAVYAAIHGGVQDRILAVFNNDGPGFGHSVLNDPAYQAIRTRIRTFIPQSSIVGMLLEHEEEYEIVKSRYLGPFQHDGFSWEVMGPSFIQLPARSQSSVAVDTTLKSWLNSMDNAQREAFVDALFAIFAATGAKTLTELNTPKNARIMLSALKNLNGDTRAMLARTIHQLFRKGLRGLIPNPTELLHKKDAGE